MKDSNYLFKVFGLTGVPRLATFVLSSVTVPIVLRSVGAAQYGIFIYVGAAFSIFEGLIDFGVSSAAGRSLADLRVSKPSALRSEILAWARLQGCFLASGFVPMIFIAHLVLAGGSIEIPTTLIMVVSVTLGLNVVLNFCRPCLQSLLAFKPMSVLDTSQSLIRSIGLLAASQSMPDALGLAISGLVTASLTSLIAVLILIRHLRSHYSFSNRNTSLINPRERVASSASFLWLRTSTRLYQQIPLLLIGRLLGPELVGIIGAFLRISELLTLPYLTVGNALMVRVHEVRERGSEAMSFLWEAGVRIASTALCAAVLFYLVSPALAIVILPHSSEAAQVFAVLSPVIFSASLAGVFAPMSDYLGGLSLRNTALSVLALLQVPVFVLTIRIWGGSGMLCLYALSQLLLSLVYLKVASQVFVRYASIVFRREVIYFGFCCICAFFLTRVFCVSTAFLFGADVVYSSDLVIASHLLLFVLLLILALKCHRVCWNYYFRSSFLDFTH